MKLGKIRGSWGKISMGIKARDLKRDNVWKNNPGLDVFLSKEQRNSFNFLILVGYRGSGKTVTVVNPLTFKHSQRFNYLRSITTRKPRFTEYGIEEHPSKENQEFRKEFQEGLYALAYDYCGFSYALDIKRLTEVPSDKCTILVTVNPKALEEIIKEEMFPNAIYVLLRTELEETLERRVLERCGDQKINDKKQRRSIVDKVRKDKKQFDSLSSICHLVINNEGEGEDSLREAIRRNSEMISIYESMRKERIYMNKDYSPDSIKSAFINSLVGKLFEEPPKEKTTEGKYKLYIDMYTRHQFCENERTKSGITEDQIMKYLFNRPFSITYEPSGGIEVIFDYIVPLSERPSENCNGKLSFWEYRLLDLIKLTYGDCYQSQPDTASPKGLLYTLDDNSKYKLYIGFRIKQ